MHNSHNNGFVVPSLVVFCEGAFNTNCPNTYGSFTDFAAQYQTNVVGTTINQLFNNATQQGIGSFSINANAVPGSKEIGAIFLVYDSFSCDITDVNCNPIQTGFSQQLSTYAEVNVINSIPEPATLGLGILGLFGIIADLRRRSSKLYGRFIAKT